MTPRKVLLAGLGLFVLGFLGTLAASLLDFPLGYFVFWLLIPAGILTLIAGGIFAIVRAVGKQSAPATAGWSSPHVAGQPDLAAKLTQLAHLNATGALSDQEYGAAKQRAIAGD